MDAIAANSKLKQEDLHLGEFGISTLTSVFWNANIDSKKSEPAKASDFWYFTPQVEESEKISAIACSVFFSLVDDEKMPSWAVAIAPVDKLRSNKKGGVIPQCRAWMRRGVMLIAPVIAGDKVIVPLALIDGAEGQLALIDPDTGTAREVFIANAQKDSYWVTNVEFQLVGTVSYG